MGTQSKAGKAVDACPLSKQEHCDATLRPKLECSASDPLLRTVGQATAVSRIVAASSATHGKKSDAISTVPAPLDAAALDVDALEALGWR